MKPYVIVATKGRPKDTLFLLDSLQKQTLSPAYIVIAGTEESDIALTHGHPLLSDRRGEALISPKVGITAQRNFGFEILEERGLFKKDQGRFFCVFFDDDFRPDPTWLERASQRFSNDDIVGLTGCVLADGINKVNGLTEDQASNYLSGATTPENHWSSGMEEHDIHGVYGCNMAFSDKVALDIRFDENLPLYGWQEDRDYTGMALQRGRVIYFPGCQGVHLGSKGGRTSGMKFGYSQIANPFYLMNKGTMGHASAMKHMLRNFLANCAKGLINNHPLVDYRGRLLGNFRGLKDIIFQQSDPKKILKKGF